MKNDILGTPKGIGTQPISEKPFLNAVLDKERLLKTCEAVAADMERDAKEFDGKPFDGKTVGTYFGYQAAAIRALAIVIKALLQS